MDGWTIFQALVDIALLLLVAGLLTRERKSAKTGASSAPPPASAGLSKAEMAQLESLMDELARLVVRAEKVADRIEKSSAAASPRRKDENAARPEEAGESPDPDGQRAKASALIRKGLPDEEVSRMAGVPVHEVRLIRRMGA